MAMNNSRVFVVNEPLKFDHNLQAEVRMIDLKPAAEYGELVFLLPPGRLPMDPTPTIQALQKGLEDYQPEDFLLLVGDPRAIAFAAAIAADKTDGQLRLLVWQRDHYIPVRANVFGETQEEAAQ
jgi:hypothetical protein